MTRRYKDWTIEVHEIVHPHWGKGFHASAYIAKTNGLKANIREFGEYDTIKSYKQMLEYTQKLLEV